MPTEIFISIAVCTFNRDYDLEVCLDALARQDLDSKNFEVIVIDNNSTDSTRDVARRFEGRFQNFIYCLEVKQGLAAARNRALNQSRGQFIAFTDDDAQPMPNWASLITKNALNLPRETAAFGGDVIPEWQSDRPIWLSDDLLQPISAGLNWSTSPRFLTGREWLIEVNIVYRASLLKQYGGFPENLGRIGHNLLSGENAVNYLISADGYKFFYDPAMLVVHKISSDRLTRSWFKRRFFWQGATNFFVNRYVLDFLDAHKDGVKDYSEVRKLVDWTAIRVPNSAHDWATLFDEESEIEFKGQLEMLEGLGYLFASQSLIVGR